MRRLRKKLKRPRTPWDSSLIEEEKKILNDYGLRRKREILRARAILRDFRRRARGLIAERDEEAEGILLRKLVNLGLLKEGQGLDDALALTVGSILERRLQTILFRKGIAKTPKQARQLITHGHVSIDGRRMVYPSYMVPVAQEGKIKASEPSGKKAGPKGKDKAPEGEAPGTAGGPEAKDKVPEGQSGKEVGA